MSRIYIPGYVRGAWNVICDRCGFKRKNFQCILQMNKEGSNLFVCNPECLDVHNQQSDLQGRPDYQAVPLARPGDGYSPTVPSNKANIDGTALNDVTKPLPQ